MKLLDLYRIAVRGLRSGWTIVSILGMMLGAICLCFFGTIWATVHEEKAQPCELAVAASSYAEITDQVVADILALDDVVATTGILEVPVTLKTGHYTASLTLIGIDPVYLVGDIVMGGLFPDNSIMPRVVLNEAATKQFIDSENSSSSSADNAPDINWLNANIALSAGEKTITSKINGILTDINDEPTGYISLSIAKELLRQQKLSTVYSSMAIRIRSIGYTQSITRRITALGYDVSNPNTELQTKWDAQEKEMGYLLITGTAFILCAVLLMAAVATGNSKEQKTLYQTMRWMGMSLSELKQIAFLQALYVGVAGAFLGIAISCAIPSFIPLEQKDICNFTLSMPPGVAILVILTSILVVLFPGFYSSKKVVNAASE